MTDSAARIQFELANAWQAMGRPDRAIAGCREVLRLDPGFIPAYLELATLLLRQGRPDEAVAACRQGVALHPGDARLQRLLARAIAASDLEARDREAARRSSLAYRRPADVGRGHILLYTDCWGISGAEQFNQALDARRGRARATRSPARRATPCTI